MVTEDIADMGSYLRAAGKREASATFLLQPVNVYHSSAQTLSFPSCWKQPKLSKPNFNLNISETNKVCE